MGGNNSIYECQVIDGITIRAEEEMLIAATSRVEVHEAVMNHWPLRVLNLHCKRLGYIIRGWRRGEHALSGHKADQRGEDKEELHC